MKKLLRQARQDQSSGQELDRLELEAKICREFCTGEKMLSEIGRTFGVGRERVYRILRSAAKDGRFEYSAPLRFKQSQQLEAECPGLKARVVRSALGLDVAFQTAKWLKELIYEHRREQSSRKDIHIGFAGGGLLRETARLLSRMLREGSREFQDFTFVFHAMVAGFNPRNPMNDPNAFFSYFADHPMLNVTFINLLAPGIITAEAARSLRRIAAIKEAYDRAEELDIVVTSAGAHWQTGCSRLCQLYQLESSASELLANLRKAKTIGDILWRPISNRGPVDIETGVRAMTLVDLRDLPSMIQKRKKVMLVLAPCGTCGKSKREVLRAVLKWSEPYITHVVADSRTAAEALIG